MFFFDYGNAFLYRSKNAKADVLDIHGLPKYKSYVEVFWDQSTSTMVFGPYRWVCTSTDPKRLELTDKIAEEILQEQYNNSP
jgi:urocanate hydratase